MTTECPLCSGVESECPCPKGNELAPEPTRDGQQEEEAEVVQERDDTPAQPAEDEPEEVQPSLDDPAQEERGEQASMGEAQAQPEVQGQGSDDTPEDVHGETAGSADAAIRLGPEFQVSTVPAYQGPSCTEACDRGDQLLSLAEASEAGSAPPTEALVGVLPSLVRAVVLNRAAAHEAGRPPAAGGVVTELELRMGMPPGSLAEQLVPIARAASAARLSLAGSKDGAAAEARGFCEVAGEASGGSLAGGDLGSLAGGDPGADQGSGGLVLQTMTEADVARRHALRHARRGDEEEDLFKGEEGEVEVGVGDEEEAQQVELTDEVMEQAIREDEEEWLGMEEEEEEEEELAVPRFAAAPEAASGDASGVALEASSSAEQAVPQQAEPRQLEPQQLEPGPTWVSEALLGCSEARAAAGEVAEVDAGVSPPVTLHPALPTDTLPPAPPPPPLAALALLLDGRGLGRREEAAALRQFNLVSRHAHAAAVCHVQRACRAGAAARPLWAARRGAADGARATALPGAAMPAIGSAAARGTGASAETTPMARDVSAAASEAAAGSGHASGRPPPSGDPAALEGVLREWSQAGCDLSRLLQPAALERVTGRAAAEKAPLAVAAPATVAAHSAKPVAKRAVASRLDRPAAPTPRPTLRPTQAGNGGGGSGGGGAPSGAPRPTGAVAPAAAGLSTEARSASEEEAAAAEWSVHRTPDGKRAFFYHKPTGQRQWRRPAELQPATSTPPVSPHPPAATSPSPAPSPASIATATPPATSAAAVRSRAAATSATPPASTRAATPAASLQPHGASASVSASASASASAEHARPASATGRGAAATAGTNTDAAAAERRPEATPPAASAGHAARGTQAAHDGAADTAETAERAARYTALMAAGHAANKRLEFVEARRCFTQAHLAQPSSITALISAANMASKLGEASEAQAEYERALALPRLPEKSRLLCVKKLAEVLTASAASEAAEAAAADDRRRRGFVQDAEGFWTRVEGFERAYSSLTAAAEAGGARTAGAAAAATAAAGGSSSDGWESDGDEAERVEAEAAEAVPRFVIRPASPHDAPDLAGRAPQALIAAAAGLAPPPPPLARRWSPTLTATAGLGLAPGAVPSAPRLPPSAAFALAPASRAPAATRASAPAVAAKRRPRPAPPPPPPGRAPQEAARGAAAVSSPGPAAALSDDDDML